MQLEVKRTRTRTSTNPNGTEANAAGGSGKARAVPLLPAVSAFVSFGFVLVRVRFAECSQDILVGR